MNGTRRLAEPLALLCRAVLMARIALLAVAVGWATLRGYPAFPLLAGTLAALGASALWLLAWPATTRLADRPWWVPADVLLCAAVLAWAGPVELYARLCLTAPLLAGLLRRGPGGWLAGGSLAAVRLATTWGGADTAVAVVLDAAAFVVCGVAGATVRESLDRAEASFSRAWSGLRTRAAAEERQRLARELHDSVIATLNGVRLLTAVLADDDDAERRTLALSGLERSLNAALDEARTLVSDLRFAGAGEPVADAVRRTVAAWSDRTGIPACVRAGELPPLGPEPAYELGCVLREALENVGRHARAGSVVVRLDADRSGVVLEVADDGIGFDGGTDPAELADRGHYGVLGMHERSARVGGTLVVGPRAGGGTVVSLRLPAAVPAEPREGMVAA